MSKQPRGIRNNNPGNLRWGDPWQGLVPKAKRKDKDFCQFINAAYGIRALVRTLIVYQDKHKLLTIQKMISRWAPPSENNTAAYVQAVASQVGVGPDDPIDAQDYAEVKPMVEAIIRHENGKGPLATPNTWYDNAAIDKGLLLAGVEPKQRAVKKVPVTKETIGATATGGVGVAQIADALPHVMGTINQANEQLSSGSVAQIIAGVVLLAIAGVIAYSQIKRHQAGTL